MDETLDFLEECYSAVNEGYLSVTWLDGSKAITQFFESDQLPEMAAFIYEKGAEYSTYINVNPRESAFDQWHRGTVDSISSVIGAYADFDIFGPAHAETALPKTKEVLLEWLEALPLKPTFLIFTGNGVHAYWLFKAPFIIRNEDDRQKAVRLVGGWEKYVLTRAREERGWKFDSVGDLPRMLRAVGSLNHKTQELPLCQIEARNDIRYAPEDLEAYISADMPLKNVTATSVPTDDDFALMGTGSGEELVHKCSFLKYYAEHQDEARYPIWYGVLSNVALCADGKETCHKVSREHPDYKPSETDRKFRSAALANKPVSCEYIRNNLGFDCGKCCGVKSPIGLVHAGRRYADGEWEEPVPLDGTSVPDFPVDALPPAIADYASAVAESTQTPVDLAATCSISVLSVCMQGRYVVRPKEDWQENVNTYTYCVMEPSERKSAVGAAMTRPLNTFEREWNTQNAAKVKVSLSQKNILEKRLKSLEDQVAKGKAEMSEISKAAEELANFQELHSLQLYVDDVTTEKLVSVLAENDGKAAILSTEAGIFDMLRGIYTKYVNIDVFLKGYSGDTIRVDRVGRQGESIFNPRLTVMLMGQPSVLAGVMDNPTFRGRGLTARFLYCMPRSQVGTRRYRSAPIPQETYTRYEQCLVNILRETQDNGSVAITLTPEADALLEAFAEELEPKLKTEYADIAEWAGKLVGTVARISALLCRASRMQYEEFLNDPEGLQVSGSTMADAIRIGRYYMEHARAAFSLMGADENIRKCKYLLDGIRKSGKKEFTRRDAMRFCRGLEKVDQIVPVLGKLVEYGYLAPKEMPLKAGKGRPASQTYLVNPCVYDNR